MKSLGVIKNGMSHSPSQTISICEHGSQNRYIKPNHDTFLTLAKWFLYLNRAQMKWLDKRETEHSTTQTDCQLGWEVQEERQTDH